jgi:hypothetical protein
MECYPHFSHKTDIYGRPVHYELLGQVDLAGLMRVTSIDRLIKHHILGWERIKAHIFPACSLAAQRNVYTCTSVLDLKGIRVASLTKDVRTFMAAIARIDQVWLCQDCCTVVDSCTGCCEAAMLFKSQS